MEDKIIVALDVPRSAIAHEIVKELSGVSMFKLGPHFLLDPDLGRDLLDYDFRDGFDDEIRTNPDWMLDLKTLDIEATTAAAIHNARFRLNQSDGAYHFKYATVHCELGILQAAVKSASGTGGNIGILAVIGLTSFDEDRISLFYGAEAASELFAERIHWAIDTGCAGAICSAVEVAELRSIVPRNFKLIVPGTRSAVSSLAPTYISGSQDHKRTGEPWKAIFDGADALVIGRQIIEASDREAAYSKLKKEIG